MRLLTGRLFIFRLLSVLATLRQRLSSPMIACAASHSVPAGVVIKAKNNAQEKHNASLELASVELELRLLQNLAQALVVMLLGGLGIVDLVQIFSEHGQALQTLFDVFLGEALPGRSLWEDWSIAEVIVLSVVVRSRSGQIVRIIRVVVGCYSKGGRQWGLLAAHDFKPARLRVPAARAANKNVLMLTFDFVDRGRWGHCDHLPKLGEKSVAVDHRQLSNLHHVC